MKLVGSKGGESGTSGTYGTADYSPISSTIDDGLFKGVFLGASAHTIFPKAYFGPVLSSPESHTRTG